MTKAIKIKDMVALDATAIQVLRVIALHLGEEKEGYVDYGFIARSLDIERGTVVKAVNRMKRKRVLSSRDGKLQIINAVLVK